MEIQKLYDDKEWIHDDVSIGIIRLVSKIPNYQFFYQLNITNDLEFTRIQDLIIEGEYYTYFFPRFETYQKSSKTCFTIISNKSSESIEKKKPTELFVQEDNIKFLLNNHHDADYIIKTNEEYPDFSVILLPENLAFTIQDYILSSEDELYLTLQYYE